MFLTKDELITVCPPSLADALSYHDEQMVNQIINESISVMVSYLSRFYDTSAIFSARDNNRNLTILKYLKDIVVFELFRSHSRDINEVAQDRYDAAMQWLRDLNSGTLEDGSLPPRPIDDSNDNGASSGSVRFGGNLKYNSQY